MKNRLPASYGSTCAGAWFVLTGAGSLVHLNFAGLGIVMAALAIAAGVLLVIGK